MNEIFLIDGNHEYSYRELRGDLTNKNSYSNVYRYPNLYDFYLNFLSGLISGNPVTLIDSDLSDDEISSIGLSNIDLPIEITMPPISSNEILVDLIKNSKSEITIFTSGTTGQPKKVTHNIGSLTRAAKISEKHSDDVWAFAYNPTHMAGLQVFFQALFNCNEIINVFGKTRTDVMEKIGSYGITHISATPTFYRLLKPYEKPFSTVKRITFGGEKSEESLYDAISQIFPNARVTNVYASTEAGSLLVSYGSNFQIKEDMKDLFKVVDDELLIHKSLVGNSESFKFNGDFYCTGDLIEWIDEDNRIFKFKSRKNELINVGGYKVNPNEVEDTIREISGVSNVLVYGRKNSILGNIICADIIQEQSNALSAKDIIMRLKESIQDFKIPRKINFVETLNTTRTGKIKR